MTALEQLAQMGAQVVVPAQTLMDMIHEDREKTWMEGVQVGMRMKAVKLMEDMEPPMSVKEAATALGLSVGSVNNLIHAGRIETLQYGDLRCVKIARTEVQRFKRQMEYQDKRIKQPIKD